MRHSYQGTILHVGLSTAKIWKEVLDKDSIANFIGGRGIAAKILWDETKKGIDPLSEENILIFAPGLLTGTHAPCSGRITVTAKGPATNLYLKTSAGGHFSTALKMAGYDCLVIEGVSNKPVYLWINNKKVELRDASDLWGKNIKQTNKILKEQLKDNRIEVACIGPAGENKVKFASIMVSYYSAAARGGIGAVMGSKKIKAIAVNGREGRLNVASPERFNEVVKSAREALYKDSIALDIYKYGTARDIDALNWMHIFPSYNFKRAHMEDVGKLSGRDWPKAGYLKRKVGCGSCIFACHRFTSVDKGKYVGSYSGGPEYETVSALGAGCGINNIEAVIRANELCNDLGLDTISTGSVIQWAMESYEKGLLTERDTEGMKLRWGSEEALIKLINMIAGREGIGNILAEGTRTAAKKIGGESWKWAVQTKGLEQSRVETRGAYSYALAFAVNPRGPDHLHTECLAEFGGSPEAIQVIKKITGDEKYAVPDSINKRAEIVRWHEDIYAISDALGLCAFTTTASYGIDEEKSAKLFQYATGIEMDAHRIMETGRRILTLERCFNIREGLTRGDDVSPWRIMHERQNDLEGSKDPIISQEKLDIMLNNYCDLHGWDKKTGRPTGATLKKLGLEFVLKEL